MRWSRPDTLFDYHRVPRQVEVDQGVAELQIPALATGFGAQQHRYLVAEAFDRAVLVRPAHTAFEHIVDDPLSIQQLVEPSQRLAVMDEHDFLLVRVAREKIDKSRLLAGLRDRAVAGVKCSPIVLSAGCRRVRRGVRQIPFDGRGGGRRGRAAG